MENKILLNTREEANALIQKLKALGIRGSYDFITYLPKYQVMVYDIPPEVKEEYDRLIAEYPQEVDNLMESYQHETNKIKNQIDLEKMKLERQRPIRSDEARLKDFGNRFTKDMDANWEIEREVSNPGWSKTSPNTWEINATSDYVVKVVKSNGKFYPDIFNKRGISVMQNNAYEKGYDTLRKAEDAAVKMYEDFAMKDSNIDAQYSYNPDKKKFQAMRIDL